MVTDDYYITSKQKQCMIVLRTKKRQNHNAWKENHLKPDCNEALDRLMGGKYLPFLAKN